jgi:hypothetical protein
MVNLAVTFVLLLFVLEVPIGSSGNCVDGSEGWEIVALLRGFKVMWRWMQQRVGVYFWLDCLSIGCGICYL